MLWNQGSSVFGEALNAALGLLGAPQVPVAEAATKLHWPCRTSAAIRNRISAGTLPLPPRRVGGRWYITAADLAWQLSGSEAGGCIDVETPAPSAAAPRRPGRPRKTQQLRGTARGEP